METTIQGLRLHKWVACNSEGDILKEILTSTKTREIAAAKIEALYKENACFVCLKYVGQVIR